MKILLTLLVVINLTTFSAFAQQPLPEEEQEIIFKRDIAKNELSIGAFNLVAFGALDIAYERITSPNTSFAIEGFILALNRDTEDVSEVYYRDASLTGKYKYFFGDRNAWGFYVNGFSMISTGEYSRDIYQPDGFWESEKTEYTDLALGFGLGGKFVAKQGFFLDLSTGIGRNLLNSDSPTIVGQFNVNLGMRF